MWLMHAENGDIYVECFRKKMNQLSMSALLDLSLSKVCVC